MQTKTILETERLSLREFNLEDSEFILKLVNSPKWLEFIGDRNVTTKEEARAFLKNGAIKSYSENGFGFWMVQLKNDKLPIGMCGLVKRETLDDIDIGFAMLPQYLGLGYGYEIANATMNYAKNILKIDKILGITDTNNIASINLLNKIGLRFVKTLKLSENDTVLLFSNVKNKNDENKINELTASFFDVFTNTNGRIPNVEGITEMFISDGMIINNTTGTPEIYSIKQFLASRKEILSNGSLTNFREAEIWFKTNIYGNIAQRFCLYEKSGKLNDKEFESRGIKTFQFIKVNQEWKISSLAWNDEI
ncbi:GNAT family N-acetyltransferase [Aquimarina sediminis]|uniref:GNAT family N-acetyltransferase n=1 Tax=Aquimarina sediminis TaxID=2070536 RepID=UPI000CA042B5|nr:GNAT family N-acetyltransferase [Aquimarina sediminis]